MYCRICGSLNNVRYYATKRQSLCRFCAKDTPEKVGRSTFDKQYWGADVDVPESTRREFYSDYLSSSETVTDYIASTTSVCF